MILADRIVQSTCPYCGVGCQVDLHIKDNHIFKVDAPHDIAPNYGRLCVKGRFGLDFTTHPSRLTQPLIRKDIGQILRQPIGIEGFLKMNAIMLRVLAPWRHGTGSEPTMRSRRYTLTIYLAVDRVGVSQVRKSRKSPRGFPPLKSGTPTGNWGRRSASRPWRSALNWPISMGLVWSVWTMPSIIFGAGDM